jgi:hypothetical protein
MDGYFGDPSTKGSTNERAFIRTDDHLKRHWRFCFLRVCHVCMRIPDEVSSICSRQCYIGLHEIRTQLRLGTRRSPGPVEPRLTGCRGLDWMDGAQEHVASCVWPPQHPDKALKCSGGKLAAYVYHMFKDHWCGDDFDFSSDKFPGIRW